MTQNGFRRLQWNHSHNKWAGLHKSMRISHDAIKGNFAQILKSNLIFIFIQRQLILWHGAHVWMHSITCTLYLTNQISQNRPLAANFKPFQFWAQLISSYHIWSQFRANIPQKRYSKCFLTIPLCVAITSLIWVGKMFTKNDIPFLMCLIFSAYQTWFPAFKVVLGGYPRCPDSHDLSECQHLYDLGRHI